MKFEGYRDDELLSCLGERFTVVYRMSAEIETALDMAKKLCVEQTVEFPAEHIECDAIQSDIIGRLEDFGTYHGEFEAVISYSSQSATNEFAQFFNVVLGNSSLIPGITVMDIYLPDEMQKWFPGPKYGIKGIREKLGAYDRPLTFTALKPMGLPVRSLADEAYKCALGGIDLIKDDHGLMNQPFADYKTRIKTVSEAVNRANAETGGHTMYIPNVSGRVFDIIDRIKYAQDCGAGGIMMSPGLISFDAMQYAAAHTDLPVVAHPAMSGCFLDKGSGGFDCGFVMGMLMRMCGADFTVFPNFGGRFSLTQQQCLDIADSCRKERDNMPAIFPCPSGGMTFDRLSSMKEFYGNDTVFLMGGGLFTSGPDLTENCRRFINELS